MIRKLLWPFALIYIGAVLIIASGYSANAAPTPTPTPTAICYAQDIWHSSSSQVTSSYVDNPDQAARLINRGAWSTDYRATHIFRKLGYKLRLWRADTNQTMTWTSTESVGYVPMPTWAKPCNEITLHFIHYR